MCLGMVLHHVVQVSEASERQVAHMRAQAATSSGQRVEALCKAQDICSQAESKADAADRYMTYFTATAAMLEFMLPACMPENKKACMFDSHAVQSNSIDTIKPLMDK